MNVHTNADQIEINGVIVSATPGQRPALVDGCDTVVGLFQKRCEQLGDRTAHREKDLGIWQSYSWKDYWNHISPTSSRFGEITLSYGSKIFGAVPGKASEVIGPSKPRS